MRHHHVLGCHLVIVALSTVLAAPVDVQDNDQLADGNNGGDGDLETRQYPVCSAGDISDTAWKDLEMDSFLANVSQHYRRYPTNNVEALAAYLGAPNFFCGVGLWCNAGQPCDPVGVPGWYVLLALQEWNNWVNNLDTALAYTAAIFGMELPKIANDLWPRPQDDITPLKKVIGWVNGIINGFPVTALMGRYVGSLGAIIQGNDIIMSSNMVAPGTDTQYLHWSDFADQMSQVLNNYRQAISSYVTKIIDAPIDDPTWGINKILQGGRFLERGTNFTQNSLEDWMIRSVRFNALGLLLQAQDIYLLRTWNVTRERCDDRHDGLHCTPQPNGLWTRYRLQQRGGAAYDPDPANDVAHKLMHNYDMTKEDIFEGPTRCFDQNDYELLTDPWSAGDLDLSFFADPLKPCNFNVRVCNMDAAEHGEYGKTEWSNPSLGEGFTHWDDRCKDQGTWDY